MAKGQKRSGREPKKPKQTKLKSGTQTSLSATTQAKYGAPAPEKKK